MRLAALLTLLLIGGCLEARAQSLGEDAPTGGVGGNGGMGDGAIGGGFTVPVGGVSPSFDLNFADGSAIPSSALVVNSVVMTPVLDCDARDISGTNWVCDTGGTLAEAGSGTSPTSGMPAPVTETAARAVQGVAGKYHERAATISLDTYDYVVEFLARAPLDQSAESAILSVNYGASAGPVLFVWLGGSAGLRLYSSVTNCGMAALPYNAPGAWYHIAFFVKRGAAGAIYVNGRASGNTLGACSAADHDNAVAPIKIGAWGNTGVNTSPMAAGVAFARVWHAGCADCIGTSTDWATIAAERFATITGTDADVAGGQSYPSSFTRVGVATFDVDRDSDGVRRAFTVGGHWPRVVKRPDDGATLRTGYLAEPQATNLVLQSATFGTSWSKVDAGDTITNGTAPPDGSTDGDAIIGDATDGQHGVTQAVTLAAVTNTFSVWAKAGAQGHLYVSDDTVANAYSYFDLSPCGVGTNGAGASGERAEDWGNGWCRVSITYTGTAAAHTHRIGCAPADNDNTFAGDGATTDCVLWGAQIEAQPVATSYIATTTASVTRNADDLQYSATDNASTGPGTLDACAFIPSHDAPSATVLAWLGASGADTHSVRVSQTSADAPYSEGQAAAAEWQITGTGDVSDGAHHCVGAAYATNDAELFFDGVSGGTDVSATMPTSFTNIFVGESRASGSQPNGVITQMRTWDKAVTP